MLNSWLGLAVAGGLGALVGSSAAAAPNDYVLEMEMSFLGMTVGVAELTAATEPLGTTHKLSVETIGLAKRLSGFRTEAQSLARIDPALLPQSLSFDTKSESNRADREVRVRYDGAGQVVELATFKRGEQERSEVPQALQNDTIDPLAAVAAIRNWLETVRDSGPTATKLAVFDGRRRYDLDVALVERRQGRFNAGPLPIIEVEVVMNPLAGFNDDDQNKRAFVVLVSDDEGLFPLIVRTTARNGLQASLYTRRACTGTDARTCRSFSY